MATGTTLFRKTVFGRNYQFSGRTLPVIKLSIKSRKNINVNVSSKKTSFWDKDGDIHLEKTEFQNWLWHEIWMKNTNQSFCKQRVSSDDFISIATLSFNKMLGRKWWRWFHSKWGIWDSKFSLNLVFGWWSLLQITIQHLKRFIFKFHFKFFTVNTVAPSANYVRFLSKYLSRQTLNELYKLYVRMVEDIQAFQLRCDTKLLTILLIPGS